MSDQTIHKSLEESLVFLLLNLANQMQRNGDIIADQPAIVDVSYGDGHVVLIGIGVQRRGQPHGTYRILFNAMQMSVLGR